MRARLARPEVFVENRCFAANPDPGRTVSQHQEKRMTEQFRRPLASRSLRFPRTAAAVLAAALVTGCAHMGGSHYAAVQFDSEPQGAEVVYVDTGVVLGTTPFKYWWEATSPNKQFINVRFQKAGYRDKTTAFYINPRHKSHEEALRDPHHVTITLDESN